MTAPVGAAVVASFALPVDVLLPGGVAAAVRAALAVELARLDVAVSTRATPDDPPAGTSGRSVSGVLR